MTKWLLIALALAAAGCGFKGKLETPNQIAIADAKKQGAVFAWGNFLTLTINFIIIAFVLFVVIRFINKLKRGNEAAAPPKPTRQEELLTEIRDLLKRS